MISHLGPRVQGFRLRLQQHALALPLQLVQHALADTTQGTLRRPSEGTLRRPTEGTLRGIDLKGP